jgi:hypothetical protein
MGIIKTFYEKPIILKRNFSMKALYELGILPGRVKDYYKAAEKSHYRGLHGRF